MTTEAVVSRKHHIECTLCSYVCEKNDDEGGAHGGGRDKRKSEMSKLSGRPILFLCRFIIIIYWCVFCIHISHQMKFYSIWFYWMQNNWVNVNEKESETERGGWDLIVHIQFQFMCVFPIDILRFWCKKRKSQFNLRLFISRKCVNCLNEGRTKVIDLITDMPISVFVDPFVRLDICIHLLNQYISNIRRWQPKIDDKMRHYYFAGKFIQARTQPLSSLTLTLKKIGPFSYIPMWEL